MKYRIGLLGLGGVGEQTIEIESEGSLSAAQLLARVKQRRENGSPQKTA